MGRKDEPCAASGWMGSRLAGHRGGPYRVSQMVDVLVGKTLGVYHIQAEIGRGGMGTVFRAIHLRDRYPVALKVLAPHLGREPAFIQRFWAEYQTVRGLYHPHIVRVYEFGQAQGYYYIAAEYIAGISLEHHLARGRPLRLRDVVTIVQQIASALDAVHPRGIIHCDLKPSNVLIERGGRVVLTDFGIASIGGKGVSGQTGWWGTPEYMAPEQVRGESPLTHRVDIYALGIMTYQMLTGRAPFHRDDPWATMYAQVHETPPPLRAMPGGARIPPDVETVVLQALRKDPAQRPATAGTFARQLAVAAGVRITGGFSVQPVPWPSQPASPGLTPPPRTVSSARSLSRYLWWGLALAGTAILLAIWSAFSGSRTPSGTLAYACQQGNEVHLCVREGMGQRQVFLIGTQDWSPVWSPDGQQIALTSNRGGKSGIWILEPATGRASPVTAPSMESSSPSWSPDGRALVFDVKVTREDYDIYMQRLDGSEPEILTVHFARDSDPAWSPDGNRIAFVSTRDGDLEIYVMSASGEDATRLTHHPGWDFAPAWSPDGKQIAYECVDNAEGDIEICVMDSQGNAVRTLTNNRVDDRQPAWSPDGRYIAFCQQRVDGSVWDIWVMDAGGAHPRIWIRDEYSNTHPSWKP